MGWDYVERKVQEALKISRGNMTVARKHILAWTYEDTKLLAELTKPHMTGIIAHAIGHVLNKKEKEKAQTEIRPTAISEQDINGEFGMEILKAIADGGMPKFGVENNSPRVKKQQASKSHIDAMNLIAGKKPDSE